LVWEGVPSQGSVGNLVCVDDEPMREGEAQL
jgi:hypothetical protein